jgi:hypothetical protein
LENSRILLAKLLFAQAGNETPPPAMESKPLTRQNPGTVDLHKQRFENLSLLHLGVPERMLFWIRILEALALNSQ